jgi:sporulation protein YlmC with PRC-barrel domain
MRTLLLAAFLSSTALATAAVAQTTPADTPEGAAQAKAAIAECDRLISFLDPTRPTGGVTVERAQEWKRASDATACKSALDRLTQASNGAPAQPLTAAPAEGQASTTSPAAPQPPATGAAVPAPRVVVQQQQPNVTVRQAKPEITVRIPPPVITVQQPQPEIIVRMPEPDVNVAVARPEVQVTIPQPQVQVQAPGPQEQANVQVERQEPNVRIERTGEPQIVYQQAEGQPLIRFEPVDGSGRVTGAAPAASAPATLAATVDPRNAQAQLNNPQAGYGTHTPSGAAAPGAAAPGASAPAVGPQTTGALPPAELQPMAVSKLEGMALYNAREEKLGEVEAVVTGMGGRTFLIVSHGGFLGLGEKRVAVPAEQVAMRGDRLVSDRLTDDQLRDLPAYDRNAGYRDMDNNQSAQIRILR